MPTKPASGTLVNTSHALATNLFVAYLCNEGSGTTLVDSSQAAVQKNAVVSLTAISWGLSKFDGISSALVSVATAGATAVDTPDSLNLTGNMSVVAYIFNTGSDAYGTMFQVSASKGWWLHVSGAGFKSDLYTAADHESATVLSLNTFYTLGITLSGTLATFYTNGVADGTATVVPGFLFSLMVNDSLSETFIGTFDTFYAWNNRILTATEMLDLHNDPFAMYGTGQGALLSSKRNRIVLAA